MHKLISNLPYVIFIWRVFSILIVSTYFYYNYNVLMDDIDTVMVGVSCTHFILFMKYYSFKNIIFIVSVFILLQLYLIQETINQNLYLFLFTTTLILTFICSASYIKKTQ